MSSLIIASYLDLMMLEISIENLFVPRRTQFDSAILKKSVVMFRLLDKDWTRLCPHRSDYQTYHGSNLETEPFNGGVSVVFAIPQSALEEKMEDNSVDLQIHVHRELSEYFELEPRENIGLACIDTCDLFNKIIGDIEHRNRKSIWTNKRPPDTGEPISSSLKNTFTLMNEDGTNSEASVTIFLRITHLGPTIISEIEIPENKGKLFYAQEESNQTLPYQCRELTLAELTSGCWGSRTLVPPTDPDDTCCICPAQDELPTKFHNEEIPNRTSENPVPFNAESIFSTDTDAGDEPDLPNDIGEFDDYHSSGENEDDGNNEGMKKKKKQKTSAEKKPRKKGRKMKKSKKNKDKVKSVKTEKQRKNTNNKKSAQAVKDTRSGTDTKAAASVEKDENIPNVKDARTVKFADGNKRNEAENAVEGIIRRNQDRRDVKSAAKGARNIKGVRRSASRERNKKVRKHFEEEKWNVGNKYGGEKGSSGDRGAEDNREEKTVSCLIKPSGCGRAGTCKLPDKKGKFGKCGKPDGEGGDPRKCGEKRKCARRRAASGTVTVGIAETKEQCITSPGTPMERRSFAFSCHQCYPNYSSYRAHTDLERCSCYCCHYNRACTR